MANTLNDLARDIALEIGIIDAVSDLDSDALTDISRAVKQKNAELSKLNISSWDENDVPDEVYHPFKLYMASCIGKNFGKVIRDEPLSEAQTRESRLGELVRAASLKYSGAVASGEYF